MNKIPKAVKEYFEDDSIMQSLIFTEMKTLCSIIINEKPIQHNDIITNIFNDIIYNNSFELNNLLNKYELNEQSKQGINLVNKAITYGINDNITEHISQLGYQSQSLKHSAYAMNKISEQSRFNTTFYLDHVFDGSLLKKNFQNTNQKKLKQPSKNYLESPY